MVRHALKNALIPVVTIFGLQFGNLLAGAVIVETVFSRPGLGRLIVAGILAKNFPLVPGGGAVRGDGLCANQRPGRPGLCLRRPPDPGRVKSAGQLARQRGAVVGLVILGALALMALGAPWLSPRDPIKTAARDALQPPGSRFVLGSDQFGRDVVSRVLDGARISLTIGLISVSIAVSFGAPLGLVSGYSVTLHWSGYHLLTAGSPPLRRTEDKIHLCSRRARCS